MKEGDKLYKEMTGNEEDTIFRILSVSEKEQFTNDWVLDVTSKHIMFYLELSVHMLQQGPSISPSPQSF